MVAFVQSAGDGTLSGGSVQTGPQRAIGVALRGGHPAAPLPQRAGEICLVTLIDLYMSQYAGRDATRTQRLAWWAAKLGQVRLDQLTDDDVHRCLEGLDGQVSCYYAGRDASGQKILKAKGKPLAPATINRYSAALSAVLTWALKRRIAPRGFVHPCRTVERRRENNEKTRFLSDAERGRLLEACAASRWDRLYLLVLMGITTGARKGELIALRWADLDLERQIAVCGRTKNGDSKVLPLVPAVIEILKSCQSKSADFLFGSPKDATRPYAFEARWREAVVRARLRDFRFHDLRHTCASMLAQSGATLLEIGDVLGHRQLQMTKRYSHLTVVHKAALINRVLGEIK